jgi:hypothetical protein
MNDTFQCGDAGALVAYLYDECAPGEQESIAAHITRCATCASEIDALSATRQTLAAWTPPDLALGFQITRNDVATAANQSGATQAGRVLEPKIAWWRAPMPAWAQAAAAIAIFAAGMSLGVARSNPQGQVAATSASAIPSQAVAAQAAVSRDELAALEQRLKMEMSQLRPASTAPASSVTPVAARGSDESLIQQIKTLIDESEERQRRDFTLRMVDLASDIETQRRVDLASVRQTMVGQQGVIGTELRQQREAIDRFNNYLITVSQQRPR